MNYFGSVSAFLLLTRLEKNMEAVDKAQRDFLNFGAISILLMQIIYKIEQKMSCLGMSRRRR